MIRSICVFTMTALVTVVALAPGQAHGFRRSQSAYTCAPYNSDDHWGAYAISNNSLSGTKWYACGVENDSVHNLRGVVSSNPIAVYGSAYMTEGIRVQACVGYFATSGGACGGQTTNYVTGPVTLYPSASAWSTASASDSPYLLTYLASCQNFLSRCGAWNLVRGYRVDYN